MIFVTFQKIRLFFEKGPDFFRLCRPDQRRKFFDVGRTDLFHRAEMAQQGLDRLVPDPLDLLQFAVDKRLAAFLPVEGNGETVHLLLNVRQKV